MAVDTTEYIQREAPDIEAYKIGRLRDALTLAQRPVGVPQYDADGNMIMETYQERNPETGEIEDKQRPLLQLPRQQIAGMTPLQREALAQAAGGIGEFRPYLEGAAGTLGQAQTTTAGAVAQAQPYQTRAAEYLDAAGQGVGTQVSGAQQGITGALGAGIRDTGAAQRGISSALGSGLRDTRQAQRGIGRALRTGLGDTRQAQAEMRAAAADAAGVATGLGTRGREIVGQ